MKLSRGSLDLPTAEQVRVRPARLARRHSDDDLIEHLGTTGRWPRGTSAATAARLIVELEAERVGMRAAALEGLVDEATGQQQDDEERRTA